jgi:uncharacterized protein
MSKHADWKFFVSEACFFVFHAPSSSILQLPETLWNGLQSNASLDRWIDFEQETHSLLQKQKEETLPEVSINHLALNVAELCNLRCTYCYAGDGDYGNKSLMSFELARRVVQAFIKQDQVLHLVFFGGEPLLNFQVIQELVLWCEDQPTSFRYSLTTNAVLLTASHIEFFKTYKIALNISYDGPRLQQKQRTPRSQQVEKKLQMFEEDLKTLRDFSLRATLSREHLSLFADDFLSNLNSYSYRLHYTKVSSKRAHEMFYKEDIDKLSVILNTLVDHLIHKQAWSKILRISNLKTHIRNIHHGQSKPFCGAGLNYISVSTRGRYYLCHRFTEDEEQCMGDIERGLDQEKLQNIQSLRTGGREPCRSCWMRLSCKGGCFHEHKMARGDISRIDPIFCQLQDMEMTLALKTYITLKNKAPEVLAEALK